jgi:hypothetical protein
MRLIGAVNPPGLMSRRTRKSVVPTDLAIRLFRLTGESVVRIDVANRYGQHILRDVLALGDDRPPGIG